MRVFGNGVRRYGVLVAAILWAQSASGAKIACVGDSITFGHGLNQNTESYPAVLAARLGAGHSVRNFGVSGTTLLKNGDNTYWDEANFTASGAFDPDVVVIMLGTNDAKPQNWSREAEFSPDYAELIAHYRSLGALVYVATPPPVYGAGAFDIQPAVVSNEVAPLVRTIAMDASAPLIEIFTALSGKSELFPDTVHPNAAGAELIADTVFAALEQTGFGGMGGMGGMGGIGGMGGLSGAGGMGGIGGGAGGAGDGGAAAQGGAGGNSAGSAGTNTAGGGTTAMGGAPTAGGSGASNVAGASNGGAGMSGASAIGGSGGSSAGTVNGGGGTPNAGSAGGGNTSRGGVGGQVSGSAGAETPGTGDASGSDDAGCGCRTSRQPGSWSSLWLALGVAFARVRRARRSRRDTVFRGP
jgi:acyl-CoA thioesterase-1